MALKTLMLRQSIKTKKNQLAALREKDAAFVARQAELEAAIAEAETEEQQAAVSAEIDTFQAEQAGHEAAVQELEGQIQGLEQDLAEAERSQPIPPAPETRTERMEMSMPSINIRALPRHQRAFDALPQTQRDAMLVREDVKSFLTRLRSMQGQSRAVTGGELTVPVVFLDLIAENMYRYSKLLSRVRVRSVAGEARQTIAGTVPEAVWTEMCGAINELTFDFNQVTVDGYKVAGYVPVCNSLLEDNDVNLSSWIVEMISESIGLAMDKAILYGKGSASRMPLGIVTRLAQTAAPADYPANAPAWVDLHTTNLRKIGGESVTGAAFWAALTEATGAAYTTYNTGEAFWCMNTKTYTKLKSKLITFTASGDVVANLYNALPIVNGEVILLEFMPDNDIVGGYGDLYLLSMREGMTLESSREVQFIQDNTVFKGKQRADGLPVIPGAFVGININNAEVTTVLSFAADNANDAMLTALTMGSVTLAPGFDGTKQAYTGTASAATSKIEATAVQASAHVGIAINGENVRNGGTVTWNTGANQVEVTVRNGNAVRVYTVAVTKS